MKKIILLFSICLIALYGFGQNKKIQAYITISEECPISIAMVEDLKNIQLQYSNEVDFILVFPMLTSDTLSAMQFVKDYEMSNFNLLVSDANKFCKINNLRITPEAMVMSKENTILYRGRINNLYQSPGKKNHRADKYDFNSALHLAIKNELQNTAWPRAVGCTITYEQ